MANYTKLNKAHALIVMSCLRRYWSPRSCYNVIIW